jgi:1-acyl-sn-glycerol-3-phosphate acyltransferase
VSAGRIARRSGQLLWTSLTAMGEAGRRPLPLPQRARRLREACAEVVDAHRISIAVEGSWPQGPAILAANHLSYLDPLVIGSCLPVAPIAKAEVSRWPLIGSVAERLGTIFVDRRDPHSGAVALRRALRTLRAGVSVLAFPEGTTTRGDRPLRFHLGAFGLAAIAQVPIVPIAIRYSSADAVWSGGDTFLPHYLRTASRRSMSVLLRLGQPLLPSSPAGHRAFLAQRRRLAARELSQETREAIEALLRGELDPRSPELGRPAPRDLRRAA